ncbi:Pre-mRNA-splicing factor cwc26 [Cladophialophora carrionii]|uniref:Pre-mRNA-splicing factor cwc26 n=1 Tax=Cladophialophora carrionii TaxID=86049 RepID=A0A1C1D3F1_9EURO|nr:Pre-mRNA-splicing factor cwc26 [Cladophialophora carrionii]
MPGANLAAYLAKNYLTASNAKGSSSSHDQTTSPDFQDSARPKKKRRKNKDSSNSGGGLVIADDDEELSLSRRTVGAHGDDDDDDTPTFDTNVKSAEFRKKKGASAWKVVAPGTATGTATGTRTTGSTESPHRPKEGGNEGDSAAAAAADRILAEAAEESRLRQQGIDDEDAPAIVEAPDDTTTTTTTAPPRMQSGARAGLQTAADTAALIRREEMEAEAELERLERSKRKSDSNSNSKRSKHTKDTRASSERPEEEETIYRDATGRRIDVSLKRAEARAAEQEKLRAEKKAKEDAMGEVQRRERDEKRKQLDEAKFLTLARGVDDEVMNDELRGKIRWDDPMAEYMAQKRADEAAEEDAANDGPHSAVSARRGAKSRGASAVGRKKVYTGPPAAPNRYGILPGWRWDGVDRSNGFEKEWFQARSKKGRMEELSYQWQMDE